MCLDAEGDTVSQINGLAQWAKNDRGWGWDVVRDAVPVAVQGIAAGIQGDIVETYIDLGVSLTCLIGRGREAVETGVNGLPAAGIDERAQQATGGGIIILAQGAGLVNWVTGQHLITALAVLKPVAVCHVPVAARGEIATRS